jgi:hypothetical protein
VIGKEGGRTSLHGARSSARFFLDTLTLIR